MAHETQDTKIEQSQSTILLISDCDESIFASYVLCKLALKLHAGYMAQDIEINQFLIALSLHSSQVSEIDQSQSIIHLTFGYDESIFASYVLFKLVLKLHVGYRAQDIEMNQFLVALNLYSSQVSEIGQSQSIIYLTFGCDWLISASCVLRLMQNGLYRGECAVALESAQMRGREIKTNALWPLVVLRRYVYHTGRSPSL